MKQWHAWFELARISNLPTVWTNVLAGWLLAGGASHWGTVAWLLAGGSFLYTAGMILNDAMDVKFDREHRSERPIPSGRISTVTAWSVGIAMLLGGAAMTILGAGACGWLVLALALAIIVYDAFHKPWSGSVLIMGSCRTLLYLVAGSAVTGGLSLEANLELVIKAVALGSYIVGLTLLARHESSSGRMSGGARLACLGALWAPVFSTLAYAWIGPDRGASLFMAAGLALVLWDLMGRMTSDPPRSVRLAVGWLLSGIILVDAAAVSSHSLMMAAIFIGLWPVTFFWQRYIAAT